MVVKCIACLYLIHFIGIHLTLENKINGSAQLFTWLVPAYPDSTPVQLKRISKNDHTCTCCMNPTLGWGTFDLTNVLSFPEVPAISDCVICSSGTSGPKSSLLFPSMQCPAAFATPAMLGRTYCVCVKFVNPIGFNEAISTECVDCKPGKTNTKPGQFSHPVTLCNS